jgi:Flp pilus assembly pilin Flp
MPGTSWHGSCFRGVMRSSERGATTVEYVLLVTAVVVPSVAVFVVGFVRVYVWYVGFVTAVGKPTP